MRDMDQSSQHSQPVPASERTNNVSKIVRIFLGVTEQNQNALMVPLGLSESQVSRKLKKGPWTVQDVDSLAIFFGVVVSDFFEDPEVIKRRVLGEPPSRWIATPTDGDIWDIPATQCEGQLELAGTP